MKEEVEIVVEKTITKVFTEEDLRLLFNIPEEAEDVRIIVPLPSSGSPCSPNYVDLVGEANVEVYYKIRMEGYE